MLFLAILMGVSGCAIRTPESNCVEACRIPDLQFKQKTACPQKYEKESCVRVLEKDLFRVWVSMRACGICAGVE